MTVTDWAPLEESILEPIYRREADWWRDHLAWDAAPSLLEVEGARRAGRLPGLALVDAAGRAQAAAYWLEEGTLAQIGMTGAPSASAEAQLLEAVVDHLQRAGAADVSFFGPQTSASLPGVLASAGFVVSPHSYLVQSLEGRRTAPILTSASWTPDDVPEAAALLAAAYGPDGRYFAPRGRVEEWQRYVTNLVGYAGCGEFDAGASGVVREEGVMVAVALVTQISPGTAHLAQIAVRPDHRGRRLGRTLLADTLTRAVRQDCHQISLVADDGAAAARRLYAAQGFVRHTGFVAAWWRAAAPAPQ